MGRLFSLSWPTVCQGSLPSHGSGQVCLGATAESGPGTLREPQKLDTPGPRCRAVLLPLRGIWLPLSIRLLCRLSPFSFSLFFISSRCSFCLFCTSMSTVMKGSSLPSRTPASSRRASCCTSSSEVSDGRLLLGPGLHQLRPRHVPQACRGRPAG